MKKNNTVLSVKKDFSIRFNEVDSMSFVWHGSYSSYFEDAREAFGEKYGLGYLVIFNSGFYAPLVELTFKYRKPMTYGMHPRIEITYIPSDAAKIIFDYAIYDNADDSLVATGHSVQVFLDKQYQLVWYNPDFYAEWKKRWGIL